MKLAAVALDYDGTIATDGVFDPSVRDAIAQLRLHGIAVVLVTGRRLIELKGVVRNLGCFNAASSASVLVVIRSLGDGSQFSAIRPIEPKDGTHAVQNVRQPTRFRLWRVPHERHAFRGRQAQPAGRSCG